MWLVSYKNGKSNIKHITKISKYDVCAIFVVVLFQSFYLKKKNTFL